jgi:hypothetical protein
MCGISLRAIRAEQKRKSKMEDIMLAASAKEVKIRTASTCVVVKMQDRLALLSYNLSAVVPQLQKKTLSPADLSKYNVLNTTIDGLIPKIFAMYTADDHCILDINILEDELTKTYSDYAKTVAIGTNLVVLMVGDVPVPAIELDDACVNYSSSMTRIFPKVSMVSAITDRVENKKTSRSKGMTRSVGHKTRGRGSGDDGPTCQAIAIPQMLLVITKSGEVMGILPTTHHGVNMAIQSLSATRCLFRINDLKRALTEKEIAEVDSWSNEAFEAYHENITEHARVSKISNDNGLKYPWQVMMPKWCRCELDEAMITEIENGDVHFIIAQTMKPVESGSPSLNVITFGSVGEFENRIMFPTKDHHDLEEIVYPDFIDHADMQIVVIAPTGAAPTMPGFDGPYTADSPELAEAALAVTEMYGNQLESTFEYHHIQMPVAHSAPKLTAADLEAYSELGKLVQGPFERSLFHVVHNIDTGVTSTSPKGLMPNENMEIRFGDPIEVVMRGVLMQENEVASAILMDLDEDMVPAKEMDSMDEDCARAVVVVVDAVISDLELQTPIASANAVTLVESTVPFVPAEYKKKEFHFLDGVLMDIKRATMVKELYAKLGLIPEKYSNSYITEYMRSSSIVSSNVSGGYSFALFDQKHDGLYWGSTFLNYSTVGISPQHFLTWNVNLKWDCDDEEGEDYNKYSQIGNTFRYSPPEGQLLHLTVKNLAMEPFSFGVVWMQCPEDGDTSDEPKTAMIKSGEEYEFDILECSPDEAGYGIFKIYDVSTEKELFVFEFYKTV